MKRTSKTEILVETNRILTIRRDGGLRLSWCKECGTRTRMLTADVAAIVYRVSPRAIYSWVESGQVHYTESAGGLLFVCPDSISKLTIESEPSDW